MADEWSDDDGQSDGWGKIDTIPTRNGRELGEIWVSKVGTNF